MEIRDLCDTQGRTEMSHCQLPRRRPVTEAIDQRDKHILDRRICESREFNYKIYILPRLSLASVCMNACSHAVFSRTSDRSRRIRSWIGGWLAKIESDRSANFLIG